MGLQEAEASYRRNSNGYINRLSINAPAHVDQQVVSEILKQPVLRIVINYSSDDNWVDGPRHRIIRQPDIRAIKGLPSEDKDEAIEKLAKEMHFAKKVTVDYLPPEKLS